MNDPIVLLRESLSHLRLPHGRAAGADEGHSLDSVQVLTAKLLLFTGLGAALEQWQQRSATARAVVPPSPWDEPPGPNLRPTTWAPAVLGTAAAVAHALHGFRPTERTQMATRTLDVAVVAAGLLGLAETLAVARRDQEIPGVGAVSLACAGLLGMLIDRTEARHDQERRRLERRASVVERLVPARRPRLDRIVVHV